jgi:N-acetylglucosamine-6-phosphate deacetylase
MHFEGPFISPRRLGAQPPFARPPDHALFAEIARRAPVRVLTMAPEEDPGLAFLKVATAAGCRCQIGHSDATCEAALAALEAGAAGFTHLFNAMRPFQTRDPGVAGAALLAARRAEIIPDLFHVAPDAIRVALRCVSDLYAVTDAMEAAGRPDGAYRLGTHDVTKVGDTVRLKDGTIAGSVLTMDQTFRNLVGIGLTLEDAVRRTSTIAADHLGLVDRGRLEPGARADVLVLDAGDLRLRRAFIGGEEIDVADA